MEIDSLEKIKSIIERYEALNVPKHSVQMFSHLLTADRTSWFLEVEDEGLFYFTSVVPSFTATMHVVFWDGKLSKVRVAAAREAVRMVFERFELTRLGAQFVWKNLPLKRFLKDAGFVWEGTLRKAWTDGEGHHDMLLYGIISEEL